MDKLAKRQLVHPNFQAIYDGLFACGIVTDYFADWALASSYQQMDLHPNTVQRNPG